MSRKIFIAGLLLLMSVTTLYSQKYGEDSLKCVENLSLYRINFRMWKDYNFAEEVIQQVPVYEPWKWVLENCPMSSQNIYLDGVVILKYYYDQTTDEDRKNQLVDSIMLVYDKRINYFGDQSSSREGMVLGRKGLDLISLRPDRFGEVYQILGRSIELEGYESISPVVIYYYLTTISCARAGIIDSALIIENFDKLMTIVEYNEKKNSDNEKELSGWQGARGTIEGVFEPFATCKDLISIYEKKFEASPEDTELLKKITRMLDKRKCTDSELFFNASRQLHDLEPTGESAYLMGIMNLRKENNGDAEAYLLQAIDLLTDTTQKANAYYLLASISFNRRELSQARAFAYKGIELQPNNGSFYMLIGDMYASSAQSCGDNDLTNKVAYWAAVDKYYKAKNVDPSVDEEANKRIADYARHFPSVETIFFYDLKEGDSYTVGCWINETTTIRAAR